VREVSLVVGGSGRTGTESDVMAYCTTLSAVFVSPP
jgi:hypothetical protein